MSIFGTIASAIFGHPAVVAASPTGATSSTSPTPTTPVSQPAVQLSKADLETAIQKIAAAQDEDLDWKHSIVDLMKLLKLDSGITARKKLASELGYKGALDGSAEMNIWLHEQVMAKLVTSGGVGSDGLKKTP